MNIFQRIGVAGNSCLSDVLDKKIADQAYLVGQLIAERKAVLVCGGMGGVMELAAKGSSEHGGKTIGILPSDKISSCNSYIDIPIATGMGEARNIIFIRNCSVLIAIGGSYGTLSEIAFALKFKVPVIGLDTWKINSLQEKNNGIIHISSAEEAVNKAFELIK